MCWQMIGILPQGKRAISMIETSPVQEKNGPVVIREGAVIRSFFFTLDNIDGEAEIAHRCSIKLVYFLIATNS